MKYTKACEGIGEYGGERVTAERKDYIVRQINGYCQKPPNGVLFS